MRFLNHSFLAKVSFISINNLFHVNRGFFFNSSAWLNFFKESFLVDFIFKKLFISITTNWLLRGSFHFNFILINKYQIRSIFLFFFLIRDYLKLLTSDLRGVFATTNLFLATTLLIFLFV